MHLIFIVMNFIWKYLKKKKITKNYYTILKSSKIIINTLQRRQNGHVTNELGWGGGWGVGGAGVVTCVWLMMTVTRSYSRPPSLLMGTLYIVTNSWIPNNGIKINVAFTAFLVTNRYPLNITYTSNIILVFFSLTKFKLFRYRTILKWAWTLVSV